MSDRELTHEQYERIADCLPVQRGNVRHDNWVLLNATLYLAEHGQVARIAALVRQLAQYLCAH